MLEQPGVDTLLMKSVSTGDDPQLLQGKTQQDFKETLPQNYLIIVHFIIISGAG